MKKIFLISLSLFFCSMLWGQKFVPKKCTSTVKSINSTYSPEKISKLDVINFEFFWQNDDETLTINFFNGVQNIPFNFNYQKTVVDGDIQKKFFTWQYCDGTAIAIYIPKQNRISFWNGQLGADGSKQFYHYYW